MDFNPKALLAVQAVVREGTVTAAARRIHRTQPVASRLISQLEHRLGFALFRREGRRLVPTTEGLSFYRETERALAALGEMESTARELRGGRNAPLRIIAQPHVVYGLLPSALEAFRTRRPELRISIEMRQREHISHWIANRQFDVGFAPAPVAHAHVDVEPLVSAPLFAVMPRGHRLARRASLRPAQLAAQPLVATHVGAPVRARLDALFLELGSPPVIRVETVNGFSACQLAAKGFGIALADPFVAALFTVDSSAAVRPIVPKVEVEYLVLRPTGAKPTPAVLDLIDCVRRAAASLIARLA